MYPSIWKLAVMEEGIESVHAELKSMLKPSQDASAALVNTLQGCTASGQTVVDSLRPLLDDAFVGVATI